MIAWLRPARRRAAAAVFPGRSDLSLQLRASNLEKLEQRVFDVLVVGGGVNGAVSAAALAAQGAKVALIDKGDFAGFTSQESSNLAWGGIKYLEGFEFGLVRKLCLSRNRLIGAYPSSVREIRFFVTVAKGFRKNRFLLWIGLWLYWFIGDFFTKPPRLLSTRTIESEEPVVRVDESQGGVEYSDAYLVDNDARFVFNFVRSAINCGAIAANYVESLSAHRNGKGLWECSAVDTIGGRTMNVRARLIVNACGPLVDSYNEKLGVETTHRHVFSRGIHLIVDKLTRSRRVLTFFADDGRLFFVIPMGPKSCIGTTDTREQHLPPIVTPEDRRFVLDNVNKRLCLPVPLTEESVLAERCGVRPLVTKRGAGTDATADDPGKSPEGDWMSLSRKHAIEVDRERSQISIFGGKLTDCLNVGEEISKLVQELGVELPYAGHRWYGEPPDQVRDEFFHEARLMELDDLTSPESSEPLSTRLWRRYGESALRLLEDIRAEPSMADVLIHGTEYIRGELYHAARREMITKLEDFLRRRSKIALIARKETIKEAPGLFEACRILFGTEAPYKFYEYFGEPPSDAVIRDSVRPELLLEQH